MTKTSFKQLLRTPWKTLLFFALMAACALLLVFGSVLLAETEQRIAAVEESFTTIGMVEQEPVFTNKAVFYSDDCMGDVRTVTDVYNEMITIDVLDFEGAEYLHKPEGRPYYAAYLPEFYPNPSSAFEVRNYIQFKALEDMNEQGHPIPVLIEKVLSADAPQSYITDFVEDKSTAVTPAEGKICYFCQHQFTNTGALPLEKGKSYVANVCYWSCSSHPEMELVLYNGPTLKQYNADGNRREPVAAYYGGVRLDEVTDGYWDKGGRGSDWLNQIEFDKLRPNLFLVTPTDALSLIPAFQFQQAFVEEGREITEEEFSSGARVCMVSESLAGLNGLQVGDRITLPMTYAIYNEYGYTFRDESYSFLSPMNAEGEPYQPFWSAEYEIVGIYRAAVGEAVEGGNFPRCFIVPKNSIQASDSENIAQYAYLNPWTCTFQIKNGAIAEFDAALRENVPEMDSLTVTYNDNGYTDIMASLTSTRTTALLLFAVGAAAGVAVVILLLYFFVVRQKKRTAIEQSLGMTRAQCRTSILAGLLALTLLACIVGGALGGVLIGRADLAAPGQLTNITGETDEPTEPKTEGVTLFNTKYSLWAAGEETQNFAAETTAPAWLFAAGPAVLWLLVLVLSAVLTNRNLKIDPILLLGGKEE